MKPITFLGSSLKALRAFPPSSTPKRSFQPFLQSGSNQINNLALQF
jgi:hypothetical protein